MARKKAPYKPPKFKVQVNSLLDVETEVNALFESILADYCARFEVKVTDARKNSKIMLSLIQGSSDPNDVDGLCAYEKENRIPNIHIQMRCIVMENMAPVEFAIQYWKEVFCHELVHACQALTGREGITIDNKLQGFEAEQYYFDSEEIEARLLQSMYANRANRPAMNAIVKKIQDCFTEDEPDEITLLSMVEDFADVENEQKYLM